MGMDRVCGLTPDAVRTARPDSLDPVREKWGCLDMTLRFILAAVLIACTAVFMQAHKRQEIFPPRLDLQTFPTTMGPWTGTDTPIDKDALEVLGKGEFLLRVYQDQEQTQPY